MIPAFRYSRDENENKSLALQMPSGKCCRYWIQFEGSRYWIQFEGSMKFQEDDFFPNVCISQKWNWRPGRGARTVKVPAQAGQV